jgi:hypothetical protein
METMKSHPRAALRSRRRLTLETLEWRQMLHGSDLLVAEGEGEPVADFSLPDVNPNSDTFDQQVSPRQYLGGISAYYFGAAT